MEEFNDNTVFEEEINIAGIEWGPNNRNIVINSRNIDQARNMLRIIRGQPIYIHRPSREGEPFHLVCRSCISQMLSDQDSVNRSLSTTNGVSPFACPTCYQPMDQDMLEFLDEQNEFMNDLTNGIRNYDERRNNMCNISGGKKTKKNKKIKKKLHKKTKKNLHKKTKKKLHKKIKKNLHKKINKKSRN